MRNIVVLFAALLFALCVSAVNAEPDFDYKPAANVVYYLGMDKNGGAEFYSDACPFIDPSYKAATYFHLGITMADGSVEPFCWARLHDGRVGTLLPSPEGVQQMAIDEADLKRGPAPKPKAMPDPNAKEV